MVNSRHDPLTAVNYRHAMEPIDPDDLLSADEVAELLGLASHRAVSVYRSRYDDFPSPVVVKGRCTLWARADVEEWRRQRSPYL